MQEIDLNRPELPHFKFKKFEMQAEEDCLKYKITSPLLYSGNYRLKAKDGILEIAIIIDHLVTTPNGITSVKKRFSRAFFVISKPDFNTIASIKFVDKSLHFKLIKDNEACYDEIWNKSIRATA